MTIGTQEHAYLADHSYGRDASGNAVDLAALVGKTTTVGGVEYKVLAHSDRPSGYQGTIYQRVDSGEIVVAHRGTEFERQKWEDLVKADGGMARRRTNDQADDAIALTGQAEVFARQFAAERGGPAPEVTVTGHSLGGTLAQISGHYYGLKGETFNAFGAASLNVRNPANGEVYRIPEGGNAMVNHVMSADLVSSASPQYGQVRVYATQREIDTLGQHGYDNNRSAFDIRSDLTAAVGAMRGGSHDMDNFLPWNGNHDPDTSVLADPATQRLAAQYDPMIDKFRDDIHDRRAGATVLLRSGPGLLEDLVEHFQDPLPAGEPARRAANAHAKHAEHVEIPPLPWKEAEIAPRGGQVVIPPLPFPESSAAIGASERASATPTQPQDPMFARFRDNLPAGTPEDKIAHLVLQTKQQSGITHADGIASIQANGSDVFVVGNTPGFRARLDLAEAAPPLQQTQQQLVAFDQQQQAQGPAGPAQGRSV